MAKHVRINRKVVSKEGFLFPTTLRTPISHKGISAKSISSQVGLFFEMCSAVLFEADLISVNSTVDICPDCITKAGVLLESKASGKRSFLLDSEQVSFYSKACAKGESVVYVLWSYNGRSPNLPLKKVAKNRGELFMALAERIECVYVIGFDGVRVLLDEIPLLDYGRWGGYHSATKVKETYQRLSQPYINKASVKRTRHIKRLELDYETVTFGLEDFDVHYLGAPDEEDNAGEETKG